MNDFTPTSLNGDVKMQLQKIEKKRSKRKKELMKWRIDNQISDEVFEKAASEVGCKTQTFRNYLSQNRMSKHVRDKYVEIGVPIDLLPLPPCQKEKKRHCR